MDSPERAFACALNRRSGPERRDDDGGGQSGARALSSQGRCNVRVRLPGGDNGLKGSADVTMRSSL